MRRTTLPDNPASSVNYSLDAACNLTSDGLRIFKSEPQVAQTAPNASTLGTPFVNWLQTNFGWLFAQPQANATLGQSYVYDDGQLGSTPMLLGEYGNGSIYYFIHSKL